MFALPMRSLRVQQLKTEVISFVMPIKNEQRYLAQAVQSIIDQPIENHQTKEIILALAPSSDKTKSIAKKLAEGNPQIVLVENKTGSTSAGLNRAIEIASGDVIIRVDAHSELGADYSKTGIEILKQTKAANVGGLMKAQGETPFQKAVAWGYRSPFGLGGGVFHTGGKAGPAESVYLGIFDKQKLIEVGGFDEAFVRGQDWELNLRLRKAGHTVWFDPRLEVTYRPRGSAWSLAKQFFNTGKWRGTLTRKGFRDASARYFAPPLLVFASLFAFPVLVYFVSVSIIAALSSEETKTKFRIPIVLATMHYTWGVGFIIGMLYRPQIEPVG